ncbi:hypothetical protein CDL12_03771 [Handroanthus impetiginosus]|uniref:Uncharacterized protein n=1 Tax=Handroanthus impetiginosus TaxID=429701 RepID=A0A2G9I1A3_9LAMI|nr:hypothetical protein CDL12_03771 [Handroanthus impetiginosus]
MSAKSKSALSGTPNNKPMPATTRLSKSSRGVTKTGSDSTTSQQNTRLSVDQSPRSVTSKPTVDRPSPKLGTTPDKKATRFVKLSELQAELSLAQEDLKKANEKLVLVEKEKAKALDELKEGQRLSEEANEKLREALVAQKRAEENSEIEKFRAVEMEQAAIEAAQRKEEDWQRKLEAAKNQHAADLAALLSATEELEKVKQEVAMACNAKDKALSHADNANKMAEIHAEKVEALSAELVQLKAVLDSTDEVENVENNKLVAELKLEIDSLRQQLENAKIVEEKLAEREATLEQLNVDLEAAKMAECYARNLVDELHERVRELTYQTEQAKRLERSASLSLESVMKQLEGSNGSLHDAESEIALLKENVGLLEISSGRQKKELEESERRLELAKEEASEMAKKVEFLSAELETVKEEKTQALNNEKLAAESVQTLLEEKNKLINELGTSRDEEEKSKKALESLASALHEVSSEARNAKEQLFSVQVECENYETQIEDLRLVLKATNEKYESMLDEAKQEIDALTSSIKQSKRFVKLSELQAELSLAQEDLKKANEKLVLVEKEKAKALDELKEGQRLSEEANEKLREALVAQKRAEENSEIEKFRAVEMEQAAIEAAQRKEEDWQRKLEAAKNQHAADLAALLSATEELEKVKQEVAMACNAKDKALSHADNANKMAEIHAEKVEALSAELVQLKAVLDSTDEVENVENNKLVAELKLEIDSLRQQLENAKIVEEKLAEREATLEQLNVDLEAAKMAECYARNLVDELHERVRELTYQTEQAKRLERSASLSLESVMKQLEGSNGSLHDAESEIALLKENVGLLEISSGRQKKELEESERRLELAKEEASEMAKKVEFLSAELETVKEEKTQALNNEKLAAESVQTLLEEKNKLINELGTSRDEEEKSKKALESLASALHEVSSEARNAKEQLFSVQVECENYETQIEDLRLVLKATNEKYESMLDEAKQEIDALTSSIKQSKCDYHDLNAKLEEKEVHLMNSMKKSEEENSSMENEISRLVNLLRQAEEETCAMREEGDRWKSSFMEAESEAIYLKDVLGEAKAETMRLKEYLMDKENQLQDILLESEELRKREAASVKKVEELSKLLDEALAKKQEDENGELTDSENDYDMLPKVVEFSEQNGTAEVKPAVDLQAQPTELPVKEKPTEVDDVLVSEGENPNRKLKDDEEKEKDNADSAEVDLKMWESCKIEEKDFSMEGEAEQESFEEEVESKAEGSEVYEEVNGMSSTENLDNGKLQSQKKKKPLLHKFGSLLRKKGGGNHK